MDTTAGDWDRVAAGYADFVLPIFGQFFDTHCPRLSLEPASRVLDIACGPGTATLQLADRVGSVDALDYSKAMLDLLSKKIEIDKIDNITPHHGDGQDLSRFDNDSFDCVISMFGLIFFPDRAKALKEIRRVLKPGGSVFLTSWLPFAESSLMTVLSEAMQATGMLPKPDSSDEVPNEDLGLPPPNELAEEFAEAGFQALVREKATIKVDIEDVDRFWKDNVRGSVPVASIRNSMADEEWVPFSAKVLDNLKVALKPPCSLELNAWTWLSQKD